MPWRPVPQTHHAPHLSSPNPDPTAMLHPILFVALENNARFSETVRHIVDHWHRGQGHSIALFLVMLSIVMVAFWVLSIWDRFRRRDTSTRPVTVFSQLAREVGLDWWQRLLLINVARCQRLRSPTTLLLAPSSFRHYTKRYLDRAGPLRRRALSAQFEGIAHHLFDAAPPCATAPDDA